MSLLNRPRNISITDAVFRPRGLKENYRTQLPAGHQAASFSSVCGITGRPKAIKATSVWSRKPATFTEAPTISRKHADDDPRKLSTCETPYPKILQDGAVENFRPQEVHEKVTYAEPLSPPNEQEVLNEDGEVDGNEVGVEPPEEKTIESVISCQVEPGVSSKLHVNEEISLHQFTSPDLTSHHDGTEELSNLSDDCDKDVLHKMSAEEQELQQPHAPINAWEEKERTGEEVEHVQEETSESETEAVLEPTFESRTSSPMSEGSVCNQVTDLLKEDAVEIKQEISCSMVETHEMEVEDKLYPDGEEMDTWDSVIERKINLKTDDCIKKDEAKQQHAEPEEDISVRESERNEKETKQDFEVQQDVNVASSQIDDREQAAVGKQHSPLHDQEKEEEEENDEEEDSQNLSVSWRTEVESDSYALENTLADTRPLIRYKSDETDGNTQALHMDESESSEGEQEKKAGETGTGTWSEGKSKKFGTMEDLCEEAEGEAVDEEYDLGYSQDRDNGHGMTVSECATLVNDDENTEEMIKKVSEGHSDEETEDLTKPAVPTYVDYELETDRLVEQELENLSTDIYSAHFAQQQDDESEVALPLQDMTEQEEAGETNTEDTSSFTMNHEPYESVVVPQTDTQADQDVHDKDHEAIDAPEKREEEDEHNASMVTHADVTEDQSVFSDFISRSDMEEINNSEDPTSKLHLTADQENLQDAANVSQEHVVQEVEVPETAEWDVLENPSEDSDIRDQDEDDERHDDMPESAESYLHNDGATDEGTMVHTEKALEISPDSLPDENDIFLVKDSTEHLKTKGKDNSLHDFFSSGVNSDFWVSSLETGATFQPDDAWNEAAEQTNKNLGFGDSLVWGNSENSNVVNWSSRVDIDSSKAAEHKKEQEQMHSEVKQQVLCGNVEGELVHSEESEVEGESWSSGEE